MANLRNRDFLAKVEAVLIHDEGDFAEPYLDSEGNWTIGVGRYIGKSLQNIRLSKQVRLLMLQEDIEGAIQIALRIFPEQAFCSWTEARQVAILSLIFNMGEGNDLRGFRSFKKFIAACLREDWETAGAELRSSKWARQVDPKMIDGKGRDDRLITALVNNTLDSYKLG